MAGSCLATVSVQQSLSLGGNTLTTFGQNGECGLSFGSYVSSTGMPCKGRSMCLRANRHLSNNASQRYKVSCSLGDTEESISSDQLKRTQNSLVRMAFVPLLASVILAGVAVPSQAEDIDWASLMEGPAKTETESTPKPVAEEVEAPSYKDLLQKLRGSVAPPEAEEAAPEAAAPAPAPLSLLERQQKRAQELAERAAKQAALREEAARALVAKREAETAKRAAEKQAQEDARAAQLAAKREAEEEAKAAAEQQKAAAEKARADAAAASKPQTKSAPAAPASVAVPGKKATHGSIPLFVAQFLFFLTYAGGIYTIFFLPEEQLNKVKKPLEELVEKAKPLVESAKPAVASALEKGQELFVAAVPAVEKAYETAKPLAAQAWEVSKPVAAQAVEASKPLLKQAQEKAKDLVNQAKEQVSKSG